MYACYSKDNAERIRRTCRTIMDRAEALKAAIAEEEEEAKSGASGKKAKRREEMSPEEQKEFDKGMTAEQREMRRKLEETLVEPSNDLSWSDVAGLEDAKQSLEEAVILPQKFPQLFTGKRKPWKGILLYGPPGTGKSFIAKVLSSISKMNFFSISASSLMSKWVGESEKMVCATSYHDELQATVFHLVRFLFLAFSIDRQGNCSKWQLIRSQLSFSLMKLMQFLPSVVNKNMILCGV